MKRKIAFILMTSLLSANAVYAEGNEQVNINLTFDGDMFIKTSTNATKSYFDNLWYYDGSKYGNTVTLGDMTYNLDGDMNTKADDVIKIDASDVTVNLDEDATSNIGVILFEREDVADNKIKVTVNYKGGKSDEYIVEVPAMTDENDEDVGFNPIMIERQGSRYVPKVDSSDLVYLNDEIIDTSKSVNKNLDVESITFGAADFTYYVAAVNQVKFSAAELEEQTKEAVRNLYSKYADINFVDLYEEKDGVNFDEAQELYSAMLKQEGKMDVATAENIKKIENLISAYELYVEIKGYKDEVDSLLGDYPEKSADFTELSETDLTDDDFENLKALLVVYESVKGFDSDAFDGFVEMYGVAESIDVEIDLDNEEKIKALHDAYEKATKKSELKEKIDGIYPIYIGKEISEITDADLEKLAEVIGYFDEAEELEIDFSDYDEKYIRHLYKDYDAFKTSENKKPIDLTGAYNVDLLGVVGENADKDTWYECKDNLAGERFMSNGHSAGVRSYDSKTGILYTKEFEFVENSSYDPTTEITTVTYPFTDTERDIPFYMPEKVFGAGVCDGVLLKSGGKATYTFNMSGSYADKLYFMVSAQNQGNITPVVRYSDGTEESYEIYVHQTGLTMDAIRKKAKTYPDMAGYITSGNYKDQNMANTGVLYTASGDTTNGFSTFAVKLNAEKIPVSVTFGSIGFDYVLLGAAEKPVDNSIILERTETLYNEVVKDGVPNTSNLSKVSNLVLNYNEAKNRGLYFENIDDSILAELSEMVLTAKGEAYRFDKNTVKAEIEFSVPVAEDGIEENISVTIAGEEVEYDYELDDESKKLVINVSTDRDGGKELKVVVSEGLTIKDYPTVGMVSALEIGYNIPKYLTAQSSGAILKVTNNSKENQEYFAYATVIDNGIVKGVESKEGVVEGEKYKEVILDTTIYDTESSVKNIAVLDKNTFAPILEVTETEKEKGVTNKSADYKKPTLNLETDVLKIEGVTPSAEEKVMSAVVYSPIGDIIYAGVKKTNSDGYFNMEIPVAVEKIPMSGYLKIVLGGDDFEEAVIIDDLYFPVLADRTDVISQLKDATSASEIAEVLKVAEEKLSLNFTPFNELKKSDSSINALADRIYKVKADLPEVSDGDSEAVKKEKISKVQNLIKQQSVLECIEEGKADLVAKQGVLLYDDVMLYNSIDEDGVTLYNLYQNKISEKGQKAIVEELLKKDYKNVDALYEDLEKAIMLNALKNPKENGVGYVELALTRENADAADMTITKYLNLKDKSKANGDIANMSISSLSEVETYIRKLSDTNAEDKPSKGSSGGGGSSMGGISVVPSTEKIANEELKAEKTTFNDVDKNHWAYEAIEKLSEKGIINGKGNGVFDPNGAITRAEFIKILCVAKNIKAEGTVSFKDVESGAWYEEYIVSAYNSGLIKGVSEDKFGVNDKISRQDICTILFRTMGIEEKNEPKFNDSEKIAEYAADAVAFFAQHGVVNGFSDGTFKPLENCTRAQAAKIIYQYLNM